MTAPLGPTLRGARERAEVTTILGALARTRGNARAAAELLGVQRRTLDRRIVALGLREQITSAYPRSSRQPRKRHP